MPGQAGKHKMSQQNEQRDPLLEGDSTQSLDETVGLRPIPNPRRKDKGSAGAGKNPEQ